MAGDGEPALRQGQEKLPRHKLVYITPVMRLETLVDPTIALQEPAFSGRLNTAFSERVNLTVRSSWLLSARTPHLGHLPTSLTASGPSGVVACVLALCSFSCLAARSTCAASRTSGQSSGSTLLAAYSSPGGRKNEPTMDDVRGALIPIATGFRLRGIEARGGCGVMSRGIGEGARRRTRMVPHSRVRWPVRTAQ